MCSPTPDPTSNASCTPGQTRRYRVREVLYDEETAQVIHAQSYLIEAETGKVRTLYQGVNAPWFGPLLGQEAEGKEVAAALVKVLDAPGL